MALGGVSVDIVLRPVKGASMATSQRLSRGFHQLGIVLAAIPLVLGIAWTALALVIYPGTIRPLAGIAGTFAASLAVYVIVRAIGWVVGAFAAS